MSPAPLRPPLLTDALISNIKFVIANVKKIDSKNIYKALLLKEFDQNIDSKLKAEERNNNFKENALSHNSPHVISQLSHFQLYFQQL